MHGIGRSNCPRSWNCCNDGKDWPLACPAGCRATPLVRVLWARTWRSPDPELAAYQDALWRAGCRWLAEWHTRQATPEQRARAVSRLQAYEREVRALLNDRGIDDRAIGVASRP
jgi:hypothetical protein